MSPSVSVILPVLIREPWQAHMTEACIRIMRVTTQVPFELVMVETESKQFSYEANGFPQGTYFKTTDKYLHHPERTTLVKDTNAGIEAASGDFIVQIGNDIITKPGWLEALLECFERFKDCGVASLAVQEVGAGLNHRPANVIVEGWYGPLMMWCKGWRLDDAFESLASDNDLIMRLYHAGFRAYRNHKVVVLHLNNQTWNGAQSPEYQHMAQRAFKLFTQKWGDSPYWAATMILRGGVGFGREFER